MVIAERISDWQIIVQQVRCYSRVLVCMYVYMSAKNSGLSIVGLYLNCTADCVLFEFIIIIIITSNDDIQPSTVVSNQSPSGLVLVILI